MCLEMIVTVSSGAILTNAFGSRIPATGFAALVGAAFAGSHTATVSAIPPFNRSRRLACSSVSFSTVLMGDSLCERFGGAFDRGANAVVRGAAADVAGHGCIDISVGRM